MSFQRGTTYFQNNTQTNYFKKSINNNDDESGQTKTYLKNDFNKKTYKKDNRNDTRNDNRNDTRNDNRNNDNRNNDNRNNDNRNENRNNENRVENRNNENRNENRVENKKGIFGELTQTNFKIDKTGETYVQPVGEFIIKEELIGVKMIDEMAEIYDFDIGKDKFIEILKNNEISKNNKKEKKKIELQIIDNYYLYQYVISIKNNVITSYSEIMLNNEWNNGKYYRTMKRTYISQPNDLDGYRDYHLIVRIIRIQIEHQIYEIIIPSASPHDNTKIYQIDKNSFLEMFINSKINVPLNSKFMIRKNIA